MSSVFLAPDATCNKEEKAKNTINIPFSTIIGKREMRNCKNQTDQNPSFHIIISFPFPWNNCIIARFRKKSNGISRCYTSNDSY